MDNLAIGRKISKTYRNGEVLTTALNNVSFEVKSGSLVFFVGPSGSGKTTLLNLIGCLDTPTEGELLVFNKNISTLNFKQRAKFRGEYIGFIFQDFNLIPVLTVFENVEFPLLMVKRKSKKEREKKVLSLLEGAGMIDQKDKFPSQISDYLFLRASQPEPFNILYFNAAIFSVFNINDKSLMTNLEFKSTRFKNLEFLVKFMFLFGKR